MAPVVNRLKQDYLGQINFVFFDVDDPVVHPLMDEFQMVVRPHFYLLDAEGNILDQWVGVTAPSYFRRAFDQLLAETAGG